MRYKFTLLKDLPGYEAGTEFKCRGIEKDWVGGNSVKRVPCYVFEVDGIAESYAVGGLLDDLKWFKREIDLEALTDLVCPVCSSTRGVFFGIDWYDRNLDSDSYGVQYGVGFECICGHRRILHGTKYGLQRLEDCLKDKEFLPDG